MGLRHLPLLISVAGVASFGCSSSAVFTSSKAGSQGGCPAGSVAIYGAEECATIGPTVAATGFVLDPASSTLQAIHPDRCTGADRAGLGETECKPVDDCSAAFPPAGADIVLRSGDSLSAALARAPAGALVALDSGTYDGALSMARNVRIVGRCASAVTIRGSGARPTGAGPVGTPGIAVTAGGSVELASLSIEAFDTGVSIVGGEARLEHVVLANNSAGVSADRGAKVTIRQSVVEGRPTAGDPVRGVIAMERADIQLEEVEIRRTERALTSLEAGTKLHAKRVVATNEGANEEIFVFGAAGGSISIEESFLRVEKQNLVIAGASQRQGNPVDNAAVTFARSVLLNTAHVSGALAAVQGGATLALSESTLHYDAELAFSTFETPSELSLRNTSVFATTETARDARGISILSGAIATLDGSILSGARGVGIFANADGSRATIRRSVVSRTRGGRKPTSGSEGSAFAVVGSDKATVELVESTLSDNEQIGLLISFEARAGVERTSFLDTRASIGGALGDAILVQGDADLQMRRSLVRGSADIALVFLMGGGTVQESKLEQNTFGVSLWEAALREQNVPSSGAREVVLARVECDNTPVVVEREVEHVLPSPPPKGSE